MCSSIWNSCFVQFIVKLVKLFLAFWVVADVISDVFQTRKYHHQSTSWNPEWNLTTYLTTSGTKCSKVDLDFEISGHYFTWAIVTWLLPPFMCAIYFHYGLWQKEEEYRGVGVKISVKEAASQFDGDRGRAALRGPAISNS